MSLLERLRLSVPIVQAPMAGVSTPAMAAAVSEAGGLGSIAVGATDAAGARAMMTEVWARTHRPFNVNLFVHAPAHEDAAVEAAWLAAMTPLFHGVGTNPPERLRTIYSSFAEDDAMLAVLLELAPPVVSFHFGLPAPERIAALKQAGCLLLATATSGVEAQQVRAAGVDAVVAQGWEGRAVTAAFSIPTPPMTGSARWR